MADLAAWVTAAEEALPWPCGGFMEAYAEGLEEANQVALESSSVYDSLWQLLEGCGRDGWVGTASELLVALRVAASAEAQNQKGWPRTPRALSGQLRRLAPNLRAVGVDISFGREQRAARRRLITVRLLGVGETVHIVHTDHDEPETVDARWQPVDGDEAFVDGTQTSLASQIERDVDDVDGVDATEAESAWEEAFP